MLGVLPFGCGQCLPCRINRRRLWTARQQFESMMHPVSSFITLTYADEHVPPGGNLVPRDLMLFFKRLRKLLGEARSVRYFAVGEYGTKSWRPHYHASLFGLGLQDAALVDRAWGLGFTMTGEFTEHSAGYVCGYVTKKMTGVGDPRLDGRHPEFSRMSLKPGIGAASMELIVSRLRQSGHIEKLLMDTPDGPTSLKVGNRDVHLGRYLIHKLRDALAIGDDVIDRCRDERSHKRSLEMLALYEEAGEDRSWRQVVVEANEARANRLTKLAAIYGSERPL